MRLTLLTCTGDRPAAFALMEKYMARQTVKPFQHIVICDGKTATVCTQGQEFYYRPEYAGPESLKNKVREVATVRQMVKGDAVCFIEDDDFYDPRWLEFCAAKLEQYDMIGEGNAVYFNVRNRFWVQHSNMQHASLCATAVRSSMLNFVSASCSNPDRWIDDMLWQKSLNKKVFDPKHTNGGKPLTVGIKGMPGRTGYGLQHVLRPSDAHDDPNLDYLRHLIGEDVSLYEQYGRQKTLAEIYQKYCLPEYGISDKGTSHSYIEEYERLFAPFRDRQPVRVLEIGLCRGGSLRMLHEYFDKSEVHGVDINPAPDGFPDLKRLMAEKLPRMTISIADARNAIEVQKHIGDTKFDIIIEDASHDISDSLCIYENFINKLNPGGLYIIEDVADIDAVRSMLNSAIQPRPFEVMDFRKQKNRFDDVLVVIK